jgi:integrating conjugative element protein (TIGR03756 family)
MIATVLTSNFRYLLIAVVAFVSVGQSREAHAGWLQDLIEQWRGRQVPQEQEDLDTWDIAEKTMTCTDCINYKVEGVCLWIKCNAFPPSCYNRESILVSHFLPDFVVSAYSNTTPWDGLGGLTDRKMGSILTEKSDLHDHVTELTGQIDTNLDFKHVDIITNPGILAFNALAASFGYSCESVEKIPMIPHFVSKADPAWSEPIIEQYYPQALLGYPRQSAAPEYWGPIYPRTGWNSLPFDSLSAVVAAQRASEILTGSPSLHVYIPPGRDCGDRCWPPPPVEVGNRDNRFQLLYPEIQDFAEPLPRQGNWAAGMEVPDQRFSWVLWRKYECCRREGQIFLGRVRL